MGRLFFLIFTSILIVFSVVVSTYNFELIMIHLYVKSYQLPLSILLLYAFIAGIVTTSINLIAILLSYKRKYREMEISLHNNQEELDNLRRNPLRDGTE